MENPNRTRAAVLEKIDQPLVLQELIVPELKEGQVLVKICWSGICRSQLNEIHGAKGEDKFLPHTLGHEGSGVIEAIGLGVNKVKAGDQVILTWIKGEGRDVTGSVYKKQDGSIVNSGAVSTFLTRAVISENRVVKVPQGLGLKEAALLGCAIPTGAGIVINQARVREGESVAIFGLGGVGLSALLAAKAAGATPIIAVDISQDSLKAALKCGATHALNPKDDDVPALIRTLTAGRGAAYAIECAGRKETMEAAFRSVADKSGLCIIAGNLSAGQTIQIDPFDLIKGKRIAGSWGGDTVPDRDIPMYGKWVLSGKIDLNGITGTVYPFERINEAIESMEKGASGRLLIEMGK